MAFIFGLAMFPVKSQASGGYFAGGGAGAVVFGLLALGVIGGPDSSHSSLKSETEFAFLNSLPIQNTLLNQSAGGSSTAEILNN